jgi:hypothetical protein
MRGKMLWFNEVKDYGFIMTDEGERLSVLGPAFANGARPVGRCAEFLVTFRDRRQQRHRASRERRLRGSKPRRAVPGCGPGLAKLARMGSSKKKRSTFAKHKREREVEEKRRLKRERTAGGRGRAQCRPRRRPGAHDRPACCRPRRDQWTRSSRFAARR